MGKKYIIELEDKPFHNGNGDFLYRVKGFNSLVFDMTGVGKLTPYTEPDLEQVRKEAKEEGYSIGYDEGREAGVQQGLSDAWEAARKICAMDSRSRDEVFGAVITGTIMRNNSASECIEKIRQYEQEQKREEEQIQVGDEVIVDSGKCVVLVVDKNGFPEKLLEPDGYTLTLATDVKLPKTGRHFPEIAEVLRKMREE